jgi:hypothetical protein
MAGRPVTVKRRRGPGFIGRSAVLAVTVAPTSKGDSFDDLLRVWELQAAEERDEGVLADQDRTDRI